MDFKHAVRLAWSKFLVRVPLADRFLVGPIERATMREKALLDRRPHRSFRRTRRRDYVRPLKIPGYWAQSFVVWRHLLKYKKTFLYLAMLYAFLSALLLGLASQDTFNQLSDLLKEGKVFDSGWGDIGRASLLFVATITGGLNDPNASGNQGILAFILVLLIWLTSVWLLRAQLAGRNPRLRDGLYQAGAPIISLFVVMFYGALQLIPAALGTIAAAAVAGYGDQAGALGMLVWIVVTLLIVLSLYWLTSTFIAMVVVTLPGMYPWQAIRTAGDLVIGRRLRILLRVLWAILLLMIGWIVVMLPLILLVVWLDSMLKWFSTIPVIPVALLLLTTASLVWLSAYIYLLYRRIVDDDSAPN